MSTVRQVASEAKHSDGLTQWKTAVLDLNGRDVNIPEWLRRVRTWLELHAIDGTASGLSVVPFVEPGPAWPEENGPNSWVPINPSTGDPAALEPAILTKLKAAKFSAYANIQVNLTNQARVIFQVLFNSALSRQSQAAVKNSPEWAVLSIDLNRWAELLAVVVRLHTVQRGADVEESRIEAKIRFESKIRSFKQGSIDSGAHLERFDDLLSEGKAMGLTLDQKELAYLLVNSMKSPAARNKRNLLMQMGQPTPGSYLVAKTFVLESEAMSRSIMEFNGNYTSGGHIAITDATDKEPDESEDVNLVTADGKGAKRVYSPLQKQQWKKLPESERKKVIALEEMTDRVRAGEILSIDMKAVSPTSEQEKKCWKCGDKNHVARECPQKETIKDLPHAPAHLQKKRFQRGRGDKKQEVKQEGNKVAGKKVEFAAIAEEDSGKESSEDEFYHLDTLITYATSEKPEGVRRPVRDASLFLDDSDSDLEEHEVRCMVTDEPNELSSRLQRDLVGLTQATRIPTDEDIAIQADLIGCPQYCKGLGETVKVNDILVLKGGPFDTTRKREIVLTWGVCCSGKPKAQTSGEEDDSKETNDLFGALGSSEREAMTRYRATETGEQEKYGTPIPVRKTFEPTSCAECARLREQMHTKSVEMHHRCGELMEMVNKEARQQLADLRAAGEKEMQMLRDMLAASESALASAENSLREARSEKGAGTAARNLATDRASSTLALYIERNSTLADTLEHVTASAERERAQCEFYRKMMKSDRLEMKILQRQLGERQREEDERVEVYRESCRIARETVENLRKSACEQARNERAEVAKGSRLDTANDRKRNRREKGDTNSPERVPSCNITHGTAALTPPIFDPSAQRSITPIFDPAFGREKHETQEVQQTASNESEEASASGSCSAVDETQEDIKQQRRSKRQQRALAQLANANGINVDEYANQRKERYLAEEEARKERENLKLLSFVLWESEQSIELRARLRDTEWSVTDVDERERGYKAILNSVGGHAHYMSFLNSQLYDVERPKLTMEWATGMVEKYKAHPEEKPKPVRLLMPERDPAEVTRWQESIRLIKASKYPKDKEELLIQLQINSAHSEENEERESRHAKEAKARKGTKVSKEKGRKEEADDKPPPLVDDSDSENDEKQRQSKPVGTKKGEEAFATLDDTVRDKSEELTIHDHLVITLDNAASTHVFRDPELVHSVRPMRGEGVSIGGLKSGGEGVVCNEKGMFLSVIGVLLGKDSIANLLSQGTLVDQGHCVEYDTVSDIYSVRFKGTNVTLTFKRQRRADSLTMRKHYVCKIEPTVHRNETALIATIKEKQLEFTKAEVIEAARAKEQSAALNFPSHAAHLDMIKTCSINGNTVTQEALDRSLYIWGRPIERSRGNNRYKKPVAAARRLNSSPIQSVRDNVAHADLLFVKGIAFLIVVLDPMKYVWIQRILSRTTESIRIGVNKFFSDMSAHKVNITCLRCDGEGGMWALESEVNARGVVMDKAAAGKHVELAENKTKQVKEGVRRASSNLPYLLCRILLIACVYYAVQCINLQRTNSQKESGVTSPYNQYTGKNIDAQIHVIAQFGTYVESTVRDTDNSNASRTESAIYCYSALQSTEVNHVFIIKTNEMAERGECEKKAMSQAMIAILDKKAVRDWGDQAKEIYFEERGGSPPDDSEMNEPTTEQEGPPTVYRPTEPRVTRSMAAAAGGIEGFDIERAAGRDPNERRVDPTTEEREDEGKTEPNPVEIGVRTPWRTGTDEGEFRESGFWDRHGKAESPGYFHEGQEAATRLDMGNSPSRGAAERYETQYAQNTSTGVDAPLAHQYEVLLAREMSMRKDWYHKEYALVMSQKQAIKKLGEKKALPAISAEVKQMLDKGVWRPLHAHELTEEDIKNVIHSTMFLKEKFDAMGLLEKIKARLVARGDEQDRENYSDLSSPTARLTSLMSVVAIAAAEGRKVEVGDIPGAYLNADMKARVPMRLNRIISAEICKLDPSYTPYLDKKGCLTVLLLKALYGCVESGKLWNEDLTAALMKAGFVSNPEDPCLFNKGSVADKNQITVIVYVDDLMVTCLEQQPIDELWAIMRAKYAKPGEPDIVVKKGPVVNFLGMTFDWTLPGEVSITQLGFVAELLTDSALDFSKRAATSPAAENLFDTRDDEEAGVINGEQKDWFHTFTAKCLYLAKRSRPEILTTVAFLCTRVTKSNLDDIKKLERLLSYLSGSRERGITLKPGVKGMQVRIFIDAAYGVHTDCKSSSGGVTVLGDAGPISATSNKQSIVTKSSSEAELVASSDLMNGPFHVRRLLVAQGYEPGPIVLYQDNLSCMALIAKGRAGSERTRHISIRYFWIKQHVDGGDVVVEKLATEEMPANILTKPLQGSQFRYERKLLTNWKD